MQPKITAAVNVKSVGRLRVNYHEKHIGYQVKSHLIYVVGVIALSAEMHPHLVRE